MLASGPNQLLGWAGLGWAQPDPSPSPNHRQTSATSWPGPKHPFPANKGTNLAGTGPLLEPQPPLDWQPGPFLQSGVGRLSRAGHPSPGFPVPRPPPPNFFTIRLAQLPPSLRTMHHIVPFWANKWHTLVSNISTSCNPCPTWLPWPSWCGYSLWKQLPCGFYKQWLLVIKREPTS